jgi:hypothetical protein
LKIAYILCLTGISLAKPKKRSCSKMRRELSKKIIKIINGPREISTRMAGSIVKEFQIALDHYYDIQLSEVKYYILKGGSASPHEATLFLMFEKDIGVYIKISSKGYNYGGLSFMFRTVSHIKDYTGGNNNWLSDDRILNMEDGEIVGAIVSILNRQKSFKI